MAGIFDQEANPAAVSHAGELGHHGWLIVDEVVSGLHLAARHRGVGAAAEQERGAVGHLCSRTAQRRGRDDARVGSGRARRRPTL